MCKSSWTRSEPLLNILTSKGLTLVHQPKLENIADVLTPNTPPPPPQ